MTNSEVLWDAKTRPPSFVAWSKMLHWRQVTVFITEVLIRLFILLLKILINSGKNCGIFPVQNRQSHISQSPTNDRTKVIILLESNPGAVSSDHCV